MLVVPVMTSNMHYYLTYSHNKPTNKYNASKHIHTLMLNNSINSNSPTQIFCFHYTMQANKNADQNKEIKQQQIVCVMFNSWLPLSIATLH